MQIRQPSSSLANHSSARTDARQHYFDLRDRLVSLNAAPDPDHATIDAVIQELERAQLAYKATYGMMGNNPIDDSPSTT